MSINKQATALSSRNVVKGWRGNIPSTCDTCKRFEKLKDAKDHAKGTSLVNSESRHVINAGDYYFSSTTAQVFWYERLVLSYRNGSIEKNAITEKDLSNEIN